MKREKPKDLTDIVGIPEEPIIACSNDTLSLAFVINSDKGSILCDHYHYGENISHNPIIPIGAALNYAHRNNREITVTGRLVCGKLNSHNCMNIYEITILPFGTYTPDLSLFFKNEQDGYQKKI